MRPKADPGTLRMLACSIQLLVRNQLMCCTKQEGFVLTLLLRAPEELKVAAGPGASCSLQYQQSENKVAGKSLHLPL